MCDRKSKKVYWLFNIGILPINTSIHLIFKLEFCCWIVNDFWHNQDENAQKHYYGNLKRKRKSYISKNCSIIKLIFFLYQIPVHIYTCTCICIITWNFLCNSMHKYFILGYQKSDRVLILISYTITCNTGTSSTTVCICCISWYVIRNPIGYFRVLPCPCLFCG